MSFFIRKRTNAMANKADKKQKKRLVKNLYNSRKAEMIQKSTAGKKEDNIDQDEIESGSDVEEPVKTPVSSDSEWSEEEEETAQQKRIRLAKEYLQQLKTSNEADVGDEAGHETIAQKLQEEILQGQGRLHREIAKNCEVAGIDDVIALKGHRLPITCLVITPDSKHIFSGSKDWSVAERKKLCVIHGRRKKGDHHKGHNGIILALALTSDGHYLASAGIDKEILIWNAETCAWHHTFTGHRGPVTSLVFRMGTYTLFSGSEDRSVKLWNLENMVYVDTLYGHEDTVTCLDALKRERAVTSGGRDGSLRIWKIVDESQLVFHGHKGSIDCVAFIDEDHFFSGADDNSLALWGTLKKKPLSVTRDAHSGNGYSETSGAENWITAVAALPYSDLVASGSKDGLIRLWCCSNDFRSMEQTASVPMLGFVNALKFSSDGSFLAAGVGQEHRLGRWWRLKEAKNTVCIIPLSRTAN